MQHTWVLFGTTNPYQASRNGMFRGRPRIALTTYLGNQDEVSEQMMDNLVGESDSYTFSDDLKSVVKFITEAKSEVIMSKGQVHYEHDGYLWECIPLDELEEDDARIALNCKAVSDDEAKAIYELHPSLNPEL